MFMQFLLSLLILLGTTVVSVFFYGGLMASLMQPMVLGGMVLISLSFLYMAGYGGEWRLMLSSLQSFSSCTMGQMREMSSALDFTVRLVCYVSVFFSLLGATYYYLNLQDRDSAGLNVGVLLYSSFYLLFFLMILFTLKGTLKRRMILFMAEAEPVPEGENLGVDGRQPWKKLRFIGFLVAVLLVVLVVRGVGLLIADGNEVVPKGVANFIDIPSFVYVLVSAILLSCVAGILGDYGKAVSVLFLGKPVSVTERNLFVNAIAHFRAVIFCLGLYCTLNGCIVMLRHLEDRTMLGANVLVALLPSFYAIIAGVALLLHEAAISRACRLQP